MVPAGRASAKCPKRTSAQACQASRKLPLDVRVERHGLAHVDRERLVRNIADVAAALKLPAPATGAVDTDALLPPPALRQLPR